MLSAITTQSSEQLYRIVKWHGLGPDRRISLTRAAVCSGESGFQGEFPEEGFSISEFTGVKRRLRRAAAEKYTKPAIELKTRILRARSEAESRSNFALIS